MRAPPAGRFFMRTNKSRQKPESFRARATRALGDAQLRRALENVPPGFIAKREKALARLPEFARLCAQAAQIRRRALVRLDELLEQFRARAGARANTHVHLAADGARANAIIRRILEDHGARLVVKGKSMVAEETDLNAALAAAGIEVVETDLGEYIIQLRGETPSHIVAPAIHVTAEEVEQTFARAHQPRPDIQENDRRRRLVSEARAVLREKFLKADAGITGANLLIAETGGMMLMTNEGNGDLCASAPRLHIVITSAEKLVADMNEALAILRVLPRSATGQEITTYASFYHGARGGEEPDGAREMHYVIITGQRREMARADFGEMLACIRCGACLNHCPIYQLTGGHAYGRVYSGPMGIVLGNALFGLKEVPGLEDACTMCNRCAEVCPVAVPLPGLIRRWRAKAGQQPEARMARLAHKAHAALAARPRAWQRAMRLGGGLLRWLKRHPKVARHLPLLRAWLQGGRALPRPAGTPFLPAQAAPGASRGCAIPERRQPREQPAPPSFPFLPAIARKEPDREKRIARFMQKVREAAAHVDRFASEQEAVAHALRHAQKEALARAEAGVAETGSLLFTSRQRAVLPLLLAEELFVILSESDIHTGLEEALAGLDPASPPRLAMLMTGPSRTADIEQTLILGAHGPRALHVLIIPG